MRLTKFYFNSKKDGNLIKEKICESCNFKKLENKYICGVCKTMRSVRPSEYIKNKMNYFSMFNIKDQYKIDKSKLDRQYKDLQKIVHPDKYVHEKEEIMKEAQECSAYLSNAYQILKDDYKRANYLLKLKGFPNVEEDSKSIYEKDFLEELMELQEKIESCEQKDQLLGIKTELIEKIADGKQDLENAFEKEELGQALNVLKAIKFHLNVLEQKNLKEESKNQSAPLYLLVSNFPPDLHPSVINEFEKFGDIKDLIHFQGANWLMINYFFQDNIEIAKLNHKTLRIDPHNRCRNMSTEVLTEEEKEEFIRIQMEQRREEETFDNIEEYNRDVLQDKYRSNVYQGYDPRFDDVNSGQFYIVNKYKEKSNWEKFWDVFFNR